MKVEHVRMRLANEPIIADLVDMELIELKFIFDRRKLVLNSLSTLLTLVTVHYDNRDFQIIPNYQPRCSPSFDEQTVLCEKVLGVGILHPQV